MNSGVFARLKKKTAPTLNAEETDQGKGERSPVGLISYAFSTGTKAFVTAADLSDLVTVDAD